MRHRRAIAGGGFHSPAHARTGWPRARDAPAATRRRNGQAPASGARRAPAPASSPADGPRRVPGPGGPARAGPSPASPARRTCRPHPWSALPAAPVCPPLPCTTRPRPSRHRRPPRARSPGIPRSASRPHARRAGPSSVRHRSGRCACRGSRRCCVPGRRPRRRDPSRRTRWCSSRRWTCPEATRRPASPPRRRSRHAASSARHRRDGRHRDAHARPRRPSAGCPARRCPTGRAPAARTSRSRDRPACRWDAPAAARSTSLLHRRNVPGRCRSPYARAPCCAASAPTANRPPRHGRAVCRPS